MHKDRPNVVSLAMAMTMTPRRHLDTRAPFRWYVANFSDCQWGDKIVSMHKYWSSNSLLKLKDRRARLHNKGIEANLRVFRTMFAFEKAQRTLTQDEPTKQKPKFAS